MRFPRTQTTRPPRRGVILMVVLLLLTVFAIIGLSFVLYADAEAKSAEITRDAEAGGPNGNKPDVTPNILVNFALGQILFGADDQTGVYSAMRGHELFRLMYGYNYTLNAQNQIVPAANNVPFNGMGRLHTDAASSTCMNPFGTDDYPLINYTFYPGETFPYGQGQYPFLRDPERINPRLPGGQVPPWRWSPTDAPGAYVGGANVPYTYPDLNNMFLAAVRGDGVVLTPSFHRAYTGFGPLDPSNPNWYIPSTKSNPNFPANGPFQPWLKYMVLRPRPVDQVLPTDTFAPNTTWPPTNRTNYFPAPEDAGGDVKNLVGWPGTYDPATGKLVNNDSFWMDLGFPVMTSADGKKYKPLFAFLIMDLDGRVNVNVHGNVRGQVADPLVGGLIPTHASNQGWGPWEVNLSKVLNYRAAPTVQNPKPLPEWLQLFSGKTNPTVTGRYGADGQPGGAPNNIGQGPWFNPAIAPPNYQSQVPPFYAKMDFDAAPNPNLSGTNSTPVQFPNAASGSFSSFPTFDPASYGNWDPNEGANHPGFFNFFEQTGGDRVFPISTMETLLRYNELTSQAGGNDLVKLLLGNFTDTTPASQIGIPPTTITAGARRRNLVGTHSSDLDRVGITPSAWTEAGVTYGIGTYGYPTTLPNTRPPITSPAPTPSEFGPDFRAAVGAALSRVDLSRTLPPYPYVDPNTGMFTGSMASGQPTRQAYDAAVNARQNLALDIFQRLQAAVFGYVVSAAPGGFGTASTAFPGATVPSYESARFLAQLAVNIVDYIDPDDFITPFQWDPNNTGEVVYGTELPRVVLNEVYIEYVNAPSDVPPAGPPGGTAKSPYQINYWVELHNAFSADTGKNDTGDALLQTGSYPVYQIVASVPDGQFTQTNNVKGDLSNTAITNRLIILNDWTAGANSGIGPQNKITASNGQYSNPDLIPTVQGSNRNGFYVVGPLKDFENGDLTSATFKPTLRHASMTNTAQTTIPAKTNTFQTNQMVLLRRLACPACAPNPPEGGTFDATMPYNPYITVDVMAGINPGDGLKFDSTGAHSKDPAYPTNSYGKKQPYASATLVPQAPTPPKVGTEPQNTFFRHNAEAAAWTGMSNTLTYPFNWLTHLDRPLTSPMELLNVSMFKPHELTQKFIVGGTLPYRHRAYYAFLDLDPNALTPTPITAASGQSSRLYRFFEFVSTRRRASGVGNGGRVPGLVNINTVYDYDTFAAVADPAIAPSIGANAFQITDVQNAYQQLVATRTPQGLPGPTDRPFRSLGAAAHGKPGDLQYGPNGSGIDDTFLRRGAAGSIFEVSTQQHPYLQTEMLSKIFNNFTTRSNVFAMWVTIGFFEVVDDTSKPAKLGAEIGKAQGQNVRHRMFAIIDRSNLTLNGASPIFLNGTADVPAGQSIIPVTATSGVYEDNQWSIQPTVITATPGGPRVTSLGTQLLLDVGVKQEVVTVMAVNGNNLTVTTSPVLVGQPPPTNPQGVVQNHADGFVIQNANAPLGNPGPQPNFDPNNWGSVVRYFNIIN